LSLGDLAVKNQGLERIGRIERFERALPMAQCFKEFKLKSFNP
jgi:hypothetical protein